MNFNPNFNGTGLIEASNGEVIVVTFNYRVGPFGFLSSEELEEEGNLNVGLHDQRAAIRWVRKYITKFGGDPDKLTLFGTCAGGASILAHAMAWGGKPPTPNDAAWAGGIAQSLYLPPIHHVDERDYLYNELLAATGCSDLVCLRALPCYKIQEANVARPLSDLGTYPLFPYTPVIDKDFFMDEPLTALRKGMFDQGLPLIVGGVTTPGTIFVPQVETEADIQKFLSTEFRHLSRGDIQDIVEQYSDVPSTYPGVTAKVSSRFFELAKTFGDTAIKCPSIMFADALSRVGAPAYLYSYNVTDSVELAAGYIVPHTWELEAVWDPRYAKNYVALQGANSYWPGGRNHPMIHQIQQYWLSFVRTLGNPNRGASVTWNPYANGSELVLQTNKTRMTQIATEQFEACKLWEKLAEEINS
jgi:acetylcholinesterase